MKIGIYPGSFDPVTFGHLDIIERGAKIVDKLIVGVLTNNAKTPLFSSEERVRMINNLTKHLDNVEAKAFDGLTVDFAHAEGATVIVRGLRAVTDFEYELQLAQTNKVIAPDIDTIFLTTNLKYSYLSSSTVKEIASFGGDIHEFVSPEIQDRMKGKFKAVKKHEQN
ncbi:pantetheine-phosphate adenylyltransferase [Oribacterium sp. P9]|uniref:pantetheine-phosphate adenylyltransferase n=1 Tax=unclassified Oribacterium TaxID=2629782 RepID=UPI002A79BF69|nr:pantetheine-phosphate adenylyltransferase [Oribacterium sp.]MDD6519595.1 pantetheine-phosphate adenylyltransferase [Oribacterium sp.]MDY2855192.1 pantetheine-phosphate adenylyltransferase [Oliverpabstia sp.]